MPGDIKKLITQTTKAVISELNFLCLNLDQSTYIKAFAGHLPGGRDMPGHYLDLVQRRALPTQLLHLLNALRQDLLVRVPNREQGT